MACLLFGAAVSPTATAPGAWLRCGGPPAVVRVLARGRGVICRNCLWKEQTAAGEDPTA
jgi:hypothetical protein